MTEHRPDPSLPIPEEYRDESRYVWVPAGLPGIGGTIYDRWYNRPALQFSNDGSEVWTINAAGTYDRTTLPKPPPAEEDPSPGPPDGR